MELSAVESSEPVWWQTGLHLVFAVVLFIPFVYLAGIIAYIYDVFVQGYIGRSGEGVGFFIRGFQFYAAAIGALVLPVFLLKRTNNQIVGAVWTTIYGLLWGLLVVIPLAAGRSTMGFWEWIETAATVIGTLGAGISYTVGAFRD